MSVPVPSPGSPGACAPADRLNAGCSCLTLDRGALHAALAREAGDPGFGAALVEARPHLFSDVAAFLPAAELARMRAVVAAVEAAAALPGYREAALARSTAFARLEPGPVGVFMGYDFHLAGEGPRLIEVNTNAGGAYLVALLARAQRACCAEAGLVAHGGAPADEFEHAVLAMFGAEWRLQRGPGGPGRVAIVDDAPEGQYLHPEFVLARRLFERHGIDAVVADAADLAYEDGRLLAAGAPVDLVYDRLTDFALDRPEHAALRRAYLDGAVVLTPDPRAHALLADKRNLALLGDPVRLRGWGLDEPAAEVLAAAVPRTTVVTPGNAEALRAARKGLFLKPAGGHGSKAAYRGDRITRAVWAEVAKGGYVAQAYAPPGERVVLVDGVARRLKMDVRLYTYAGEVLVAAARLYQGQTTNFRTPGGGFAPLFAV